jgi:DNA-binding NarL/FixJ family response regulator
VLGELAAHHVAAIMSKLDARSRVEAVAQALRDGLIEPR